MQHEKQALRDLVTYCRNHYSDNTAELHIIDEFSRSYRSNNPIWWYTRHSFTYQML